MIIPPALKVNDTVAIVAPAGKPDQDLLEAGIAVLQLWGLHVRRGKNIYSQSHGYMAGTDAERLQDLQDMLNDEQISAVFCARGGYGCSRIADELDLNKCLHHPKWLIGYSDITALHLKFLKAGLASIHGEVPVHFARASYAQGVNQLKALLFGESAEIKSAVHQLQRNGFAQGNLVGGNLSLLVDALGTKTDFDSKGKVLVLEEIDEYYYKVDRMLTQLLRAGKLDNLAGLVIGQFSSMKDTKQAFNESVAEIVMHKVSPFTYPVAFNFPIGHEPFNLSWIHGARVALNVNAEGAAFSYINNE